MSINIYEPIKWLLIISLLTSLQSYTQENWTNCLGNQICTPVEYDEPKSLRELCEKVNEAVLKNQTIKAIGNGYSISDIGCTNGRLISLKYLNQIRSIDLEKKLVRVEAGISISELNEKLAVYELALPNQAAITEISLGGALSTGVHGTGHTGTLSSFLREIELITADGTLLKLSPNSDCEAFEAAAVGLGSLGIIYAVTLQCESLFYLRPAQEITTLEYVLESYKTLNDSNDFFQFFWNTDNNSVVINKWNRCEKNDSKDSIPSYKALPWYLIDANDKDLFSEIAVPIDFLAVVVDKIAELIQKYRDLGAKVTDLNIRFVEKDLHALLSPASNGPVAYIAFCILEEDKHLMLYKDLEENMMRFQGRPHWGKINFLDYKKTLQLYGTNLEKFIQVKRRLDPNGVFSNQLINHVLDPETTTYGE
ncbi:MAG: FAD-binding protein [Parachlamydiaceae bacterium]|nr:FAD-binding protein [Parachlamydiaceae bacterium]